MTSTRTPRHTLGAVALSILALLVAVNLGGCSSDESPLSVETNTAPQLPNPEALQFDFSFFAAGETMDKSTGTHDNFVNAYLRAVVLEAMAELTLAAPVTVFAAALHTDPVAREDGSWVWNYAFQDEVDSVLITLVGRPENGQVLWELRLSGRIDGQLLEDATWFDGYTQHGGDTGQWYFYELAEMGQPLCGEIAWGDDAGGRYLSFTSRAPESDGDTLRFSDNDPDFAIEYTDADTGGMAHIRWHADGSGSLLVPDYNNGEEACWDTRQRNADCS